MTCAALFAAAFFVPVQARSTPTASPVPSPKASVEDLAPADDYFGRQKLSVLVIRHRIFALKDDLHRRRRRPDAIEREADSLNDAFSDWSNQFPRDAWLPRTGWELGTLYEELPGSDARDRATALLTYVQAHYAGSPFAVSSKNDLTRGIGIREWPAWAGAPPATPASEILASAQQLEKQARARNADTKVLEAQADGVARSFMALPSASNDPAYSRAAWELAVLYELLPGDTARDQAVRMLALVLDRFPNTVFAAWSLRDLERGVGVRESVAATTK